jgi:hypothetical protein
MVQVRGVSEIRYNALDKKIWKLLKKSYKNHVLAKCEYYKHTCVSSIVSYCRSKKLSRLIACLKQVHLWKKYTGTS